MDVNTELNLFLHLNPLTPDHLTLKTKSRNKDSKHA